MVETNERIKIINRLTSGQEINLSTFKVFFSGNIRKPTQEDLAQIMGVRHVFGTWVYFGLPSTI